MIMLFDISVGGPYPSSYYFSFEVVSERNSGYLHFLTTFIDDLDALIGKLSRDAHLHLLILGPAFVL